MKTMGFVKSKKKNENRRILTLKTLQKINYPEKIFVEEGYGEILGIDDEAYKKLGCNVSDFETVLQADIICDPKIGDSDYIELLDESKILFGWFHAVQNTKLKETMIAKKITAYAWEEMFEKNIHVFQANNELAGEAAILHSFLLYGELPQNMNVAIIGKGNTARGAMKMLYKLGANIDQYDRKSEKNLIEKLSKYDVVVNAVLWDTMRKDYIISKKDLKKMKPNSLIIDISCDHDGAIETSKPTTMSNPMFRDENIWHYAVDHTPTILYKEFVKKHEILISKYINELLEDSIGECLLNSKILENGKILDEKMIVN